MDTSLPPGKELSVRLSIIRPLKIESSGAVFLFYRKFVFRNLGVMI